MSSGRLFLDRVGRHQSPSPLHRRDQNKSIARSEETIYPRAVSSVLTGCLTFRDKRMDHFTRRIIGFDVHRGGVEGEALCWMFQRASRGQRLPKYLSPDHDPLYRFHQWQANLRVLEVRKIKTVPYIAAFAIPSSN